MGEFYGSGIVHSDSLTWLHRMEPLLTLSVTPVLFLLTADKSKAASSVQTSLSQSWGLFKLTFHPVHKGPQTALLQTENWGRSSISFIHWLWVSPLWQSSWSSWKVLNKGLSWRTHSAASSISIDSIIVQGPTPKTCCHLCLLLTIPTHTYPQQAPILPVILKQPYWGPESFTERSHWLQKSLFLIELTNHNLKYKWLFSLKRFS